MPDVSLAKEKVKNREDSSGLSSVAPHYFRGDFFFFLFSSPGPFGVIEAQTDQEMQIIPVLKTSSDVIVGTVRGSWPGSPH